MTADAHPDERPWYQCKRWWGAAALLVCCLATVAFLTAVTPVQDLRERAIRLGALPGPEDPEPEYDPPERTAMALRLIGILEGLPAHECSSSQFSPVPAAFAAWLETHSHSLDEAEALALALGPAPLREQPDPSGVTPILRDRLSLAWDREAWIWRLKRLPGERLPDATKAILALDGLQREDGLIGLKRHEWSVRLLATAVLPRKEELGYAREELALRCRRLATGAYLWQAAITDLGALFTLLDSTASFEQGLRTRGLCLPEPMHRAWVRGLIRESGRRTVLAHHLALVTDWPADGDPSRFLLTMDRYFHGRELRAFVPGGILEMTVNPWSWAPPRYLLAPASEFAALASELLGEPWPEDPWAPGTRLKPILRDSLIIGGYSVGPDGHDDGGDRSRDWAFPLYAPLTGPRTSLATP